MLQNAYLLAKIGADTAENEQHFAEISPKTGNYLHRRARRVVPTEWSTTSHASPRRCLAAAEIQTQASGPAGASPGPFVRPSVWGRLQAGQTSDGSFLAISKPILQ